MWRWGGGGGGGGGDSYNGLYYGETQKGYVFQDGG